MKSFSFCLTSTKLEPLVPMVLDHWFFSDPVDGINFVYPLSTGRGTMTTASACPVVGDDCFSASVCGGYFFPWGYQVQDETSQISLGYQGKFKGDVTITFVPSCLNIEYHDVFKISYDFSDGTVYSVQKKVLARQLFDSVDQYTSDINFDSPKFVNVSHVFYASSVPVTYTPAITVFYGDCTFVYFYFSFTVIPNSIYEIDNVHLVNAVQLPRLAGNNLNILEIESENQISNIIITPN